MSLGLKQNNLISSTLDITNLSNAGQPTTFEISIFPYASLANKPISGSGIVISTATIPVISVNYNTTTRNHIRNRWHRKIKCKSGGIYNYINSISGAYEYNRPFYIKWYNFKNRFQNKL